MEGRKLQKVGYSTFTISLPAKWIKQNRLKKGDVIIYSQEEDGSLKLAPINMVKSKEDSNHVVVNLDLCDNPKLLERIIVGCYIIGCQTITISSQNKICGEWLSTIRNITFKLIGLSIMEEESHKVTLQCSMDVSSITLTTMLRRLFTLTITMFTEVLDGLLSLDPTLLKEVINRESEADMLYWLIVRAILCAQLNHNIAEKIGIEDPRNLLGYRVISKCLESVADYLEIAAKHILKLVDGHGSNLDKSIVKDLHQMGEKALGIYTDAFESLITNELKKASNSIEKKKKFEFENEKFLGKILETNIETKVAVSIACISQVFERISDYGASIAHITVNRYLEKPSKIVLYSKREVSTTK
ncbi:MAG: PhoU domain-containing protein [Candidatus Bathyarchaeota archaeon]